MKKTNMSDLVKKIEEMKILNVPDEKIKEILELDTDVSVILQKFEEQKNFKNVHEVEEILIKELGAKFNYHKVLRLIKSGELTGHKGSNKEGYKVHNDEIERFITDAKMTKEDWKKRALKAEQEVEELRKQLAADTAKPKRKPAGARKEEN